MKKTSSKYYNLSREWFAGLSAVKQLSIVFSISMLIVIVSGIFLGSIENSYGIFIDPPALFTLKDSTFHFVISFILMISGLLMLAFVISVITSSMETVIRNIRMGKLKYIGSDHTLIINYNEMIFDILEELNMLHEDHDDVHEVVIVTNDDSGIEKFQEKLKRNSYKHLRVYVRFGDLFSMARYKELSILEAYSILILRDYSIKDVFVRDNNNLKILNYLYSNEEFRDVLNQRRKDLIPMKALVVFSQNKHFKDIVNHATDSHFLAIAPKDILNSVLNISMLNIDFYNIWSELLSFDGYELYFIDPKKHNLINQKYKDIVLKQENGLLIGLSRVVDSNFRIMLNALETTIIDGDWLIFIALNKHEISFKGSYLSFDNNLTIAQPKETFNRNIIVIGSERELKNNDFIDAENSVVVCTKPTMDELFDIAYFEKWLEEFDTIVCNLDDELTYRVALNLIVNYKTEELNHFVFLVNDALIASQLRSLGLHNTILSNILFSRYISQIVNQITLDKIFQILFVKDGPEINVIEISEIQEELLNDMDRLKYELVNNNITYLGSVHNNGDIVFESNSLKDMSRIIVLSDGEY